MPIPYVRNPQILGEDLRRTRLLAGLTQRTLAQQFGVTEQSVALWGAGRGPAPGPASRDARPITWSRPWTDLRLDPDRLAAIRRRLGVAQGRVDPPPRRR